MKKIIITHYVSDDGKMESDDANEIFNYEFKLKTSKIFPIEISSFEELRSLYFDLLSFNTDN